MAILEIKDLHKSFGDNGVLKGIDLSLEKGEVLVIIGSSGSGKTTLLRCLNFLETPDKGSISVNSEQLFNSEDANTLSERSIRKNRLHFGLVFQQFNLFPQYTVKDNITLAPRLALKAEIKELKKQKGSSAAKAEKAKIEKEIEEQALDLLKKVGLSEKVSAYPCELSGGQQQRVAIARALASKPAIILADEPTGNLDSKTSQDVLGLLKITSQKFSQTMVMITHTEELAQMADRIIRIEDGRIVSQN